MKSCSKGYQTSILLGSQSQLSIEVSQWHIILIINHNLNTLYDLYYSIQKTIVNESETIHFFSKLKVKCFYIFLKIVCQFF